jgi:hypothetical protein
MASEPRVKVISAMPITHEVLTSTVAGPEAPRGRTRMSLDLQRELPCRTDQVSQRTALLDRLAREQPTLQRVFIALRRPRPGSTAVHAAAFFAADRRRHAGFARAGLRAASSRLRQLI